VLYVMKITYTAWRDTKVPPGVKMALDSRITMPSGDFEELWLAWSKNQFTARVSGHRRTRPGEGHNYEFDCVAVKLEDEELVRELLSWTEETARLDGDNLPLLPKKVLDAFVGIPEPERV